MTSLESVTGEALRLVELTKIHGAGIAAVAALDDVTLALPEASFTAVMGPSGSGKSTLLHCAAGLDRPTRGRVYVDGTELTGAGETERTRFRRRRIGVVFQQFNLLVALTVAQNVALPLRLAGARVEPARTAAILERVGLGDRLHDRPAELSGGQQQRVAIARALITEPRVILADEPTGALDTGGAREILGLLRETVDELGGTVAMVTHDPVAAAFADRVVFLADGRIVGRLERPSADAVAERMTHLGDEAALQRRVAVGV